MLKQQTGKTPFYSVRSISTAGLGMGLQSDEWTQHQEWWRQSLQVICPPSLCTSGQVAPVGRPGPHMLPHDLRANFQRLWTPSTLWAEGFKYEVYDYEVYWCMQANTVETQIKSMHAKNGALNTSLRRLLLFSMVVSRRKSQRNRRLYLKGKRHGRSQKTTVPSAIQCSTT